MENNTLDLRVKMGVVVVFLLVITVLSFVFIGWKVALFPLGFAVSLDLFTVSIYDEFERRGCCLVIISTLITAGLVIFAIVLAVLKILGG